MISFSLLWLPTSLLDIGSYHSPLWLPGCLHDTKSNCLCLIAPIGKSTDQEPGLLRLLISCSVHNQTYLVNERMIYIPLPFHQFLFPVSMKALKSCIIHQSAHLLARLYNCSLMYPSIHQSGDKLWTYWETTMFTPWRGMQVIRDRLPFCTLTTHTEKNSYFNLLLTSVRTGTRCLWESIEPISCWETGLSGMVWGATCPLRSCRGKHAHSLPLALA